MLINSKSDYTRLCRDYSLPLHFTPEWLDAVCVKGQWSYNIVEDPNGNLEGIQVYHYRKYRGFRFILMPMMTSYSGIYLNYPEGIKEHSKISFQHRVTNALMSQLPAHDFYYQQFLPEFSNWMPLYWKGYKQTTRYTYRIDTSRSEDEIWRQLKSNVRTNIRKAQDLYAIDSVAIDAFWKALDRSYRGRNKHNPFRKEVLTNIYQALYTEGRCQLTVARDNKGQIHAGIMTVNDENVQFYICGFFEEDHKNKHPFSLLLWSAVRSCNQGVFDFEGSMIEDIENFFRTFGGTLIPHFKVWKTKNILLKILFKFYTPDFLK